MLPARSFELRIASFDNFRAEYSTSISGATPMFSTSHSPFIVESEVGRGDAAAVDRRRKTERSHQRAPRARPDQWSNLAQTKIERHRIAAGTLPIR